MQELLTAFGIDWKLLIAQGVNFLIVFGGLSFFLYKPLMKMLAEREAKIKQGVKDAEEAARARVAVEAEKQGVIAAAHREGESIVGRAQEEGKSERDTIIKRAQDRAEGMVRDAAAEGEALKAEQMKKSEQEIARTAVLAAEKLLANHELGFKN